MRILVVEDEPAAAAVLAKGLREFTYAVDVAGNGDDALEQIAVNDYDLVILDVLLPGINGLDLCRQLREARIAVPILMLTARGGLDQRVEGLDAGADDYLPKPYHFPELLARVRALLRRGPNLEAPVLAVEDLTMDPRARRVERAGHHVQLTSKEYALLEYLMRHPNRVLTRTSIAEHVWDYSFDWQSNVVDVFVNYLRRKLEGDGRPKLIHTIRGVGYMIKEPDAEQGS